MAFPDSIDSFITHTEILAADVPYVERFQVLKLKSNRTPDEENEMASLLTRLRSKFISSEDFNKFQEALVNMQVFIRDNVVGYINTMKTEVDTAKDQALIAIEQKKNGVIDYLDGTEAGEMRNDIGVMADLTTIDKESLVRAINEVNAKSPADASTAQKGIVQLSSTASTSEILAATPKLVKDTTDSISSTLSSHTGSTSSVHGSTSTATANRIIQRDSTGRAKVASPSASDDIARLDTVTSQVGTLSSLQTTTKTNAVAAINELFTSVSSGKSNIETAITGKGGTVSKAGSVATFPELVNGVNSIEQGIYSVQILERPTTTRSVAYDTPLYTKIADLATIPAKTKLISIQTTTFHSDFSTSMQMITGSTRIQGSVCLVDSYGVRWLVLGCSNYRTHINSMTIDIQAGLARTHYSDLQANANVTIYYPRIYVGSAKPANFNNNNAMYLQFILEWKSGDFTSGMGPFTMSGQMQSGHLVTM